MLYVSYVVQIVLFIRVQERVSQPDSGTEEKLPSHQAFQIFSPFLMKLSFAAVSRKWLSAVVEEVCFSSCLSMFTPY